MIRTLFGQSNWIDLFRGSLYASLVSLTLLASATVYGQEQQPQKTEPSTPSQVTAASDSKVNQAKSKDWRALKGKWKACQFGGDGPIEFEEDVIKLGFGDPLTGIRWEGDVIRDNYEIELEARRTDGFDFFCGLTFPVAEDHVSFILGGWGGGVVGISSVDGRDASENDTTSFRNFDNDQWYKVRVRVTPETIICWIDDKEACRQSRQDHEFDIRYEMDPCTPLGIAAFQCKSELRHIRMRKLPKSADDAKPQPAESDRSK